MLTQRSKANTMAYAEIKERRFTMTIIAGRFKQQDMAENAAVELQRSGFSPEAMSLFYVNPQGQHGTYPVGGDEDESEGTHSASKGAAKGVAGGVGVGTLVGAATLPVLGPAGPLLGAAVGAYTGSLVGALNKMEKTPGDEANSNADSADMTDPAAQELHPRKGGVLLAVNVETPEHRADAVRILGAHAQEVDEAEGVIRDGDWIDFNPLDPVKVVDQA